ncbi:MAG: hypothetical protein M0Q13_02740 [Methanothrix sp.]|jgi:hypothetical protein|nr:hypothetical protein [Methanothrix sp.]
MSVRSTSLKAILIRLLQEKNQPCYLSDIYKNVSEKLNKKDSINFKAQIRGILNSSIKSEEGIFRRVPNVKGLYTICDIETDIERYIKEVDEVDEDEENVINREDAIKIYNTYLKLAYSEANKLHGTSCIVPIDELHSSCRIALYKGACSYKTNRAKSDGNSPIPYLKRYVYGSLLNTIREQKNWNSRNINIENEDVANILNVENIGELSDNSDNFVEEIELKQLKELLILEMKEHLNEDEFDVIVKRWGLDDRGGLTFKEIGREICFQKDKGNTDESAKSLSWQIELKARQKLKKNSVILRKIFEAYCV